MRVLNLLELALSSVSTPDAEPHSANWRNPSVATWSLPQKEKLGTCEAPIKSLKWVSQTENGKSFGWVTFDQIPSIINWKRGRGICEKSPMFRLSNWRSWYQLLRNYHRPVTDLAPISCYVLLLYLLLYSAYFRFTAKSNIFHPFHPLFTGKLYTRVEQRAENWNFIDIIFHSSF